MNLKVKPKLSILLVDDDQGILGLLKESCLDLSFEVYLAGNGQEALDFLLKNKVDCIVTDIAMPIMNGISLIKLLREKGDSTPFFFITGYQDYPREELTLLKPSAIIFKPFDFEEAAILIKNHLMRL